LSICFTSFDGKLSDNRQVGVTAFGVNLIWCINAKILGRHEWDIRIIWLTPHAIRVFTHLDSRILSDGKLSKVQILGSGTSLYSVTMFFAKLAIFLLYRRLFAVYRWTRIAIYFGIIFSGLFYVASIITHMILCIPRQSESWTSLKFATRCEKSIIQGLLHGVFGVVSDIYIFILPLPVVFGLQMSRKKKWGVIAIFFTGFL
jgi:hypothetical protein